MVNQIPNEAITPIAVTSINQKMLIQSAPVFIFNIGPEQHTITRGGLGTFVIPACPKGTRVSRALQLSGIYPEHQNLGEVVTVNYLFGTDLALDIIGVNSTLPTKHEYTTNLEWKGVFMSENEDPTDEEIAAAKAKRLEFAQFFVSDGDRRMLNGNGENGAGGIGANHRSFTQELGLKRTWAEVVTMQDECPACGSPIRSGVAVCSHCSAVIDEDKARKYFPERFRTADTTETAEVPAKSTESPKPAFDRKGGK